MPINKVKYETMKRYIMHNSFYNNRFTNEFEHGNGNEKEHQTNTMPRTRKKKHTKKIKNKK